MPHTTVTVVCTLLLCARRSAGIGRIVAREQGQITPATDATGHIHDRSPVILPASFWEHWLDPSITDRDEVQAMVNSIPEPHLQPYQVSTAVNNVENDRPELLNPVGEDEK